MKTKINHAKSAAIILGIAAISVFTLPRAAAQDNGKNKPWDAPESAEAIKNPLTVDENLLTTGKENYSRHCKSCHGSKGRGDGPKAANIDISCGDFTSEEFAKETDGSVFWKATEGRKPMPSFKEKLSDEERWQIIAYIMTLKKVKL